MGVDQFDNMSADMFDEFDLDVEESQVEQGKVSKAVKGTAKLLGATGKGAMNGVRQELNNRFPKTSSLVNEAIATVDDFKKLQQDLSNELSPAVNTMKQIALRTLPMAENLMPKKWYDSIKKKLEESVQPQESKRNTEEEFRNETIRASLQSIFEGQAAVQKQLLVKQDADRLVDQKLREQHFKASFEVMSKLGDDVKTISSFITGTYTGYLKKSLEMKYQGLFVMRDIHKAVVAIAKITENRLEEIKNNTGLPDFAKQTNLRAGGLAASRGNRPQSYNEYIGSFRSTMMQNLSKSIMGNVKEFTRGVIPGLDMASSMMTMIPGMEKATPLTVIAPILGWAASLYGGNKAYKFLEKHRRIASLIENKGAFLKERMIGMAQKWAESHRGRPGSLWSILADAMPTFNKQGIRNSMLEGANEAVPFDNTTRQTIVEVIPRHLERIGNLTEALQKALAPNAKINQMTFNVHQRKLTTIEEAREDFIEREFGNKSAREERMDRTMSVFRAVMKTGNTHKTNEKKVAQDTYNKLEQHLKRFIINSATAHRFFDHDELEKFITNRNETQYIRYTMEGIPDEQRVELATMLVEMCWNPDTGKPNQLFIDRITNAIAERMNDTNIQELMSKAGEGFGQSQLFSDMADYKKGVQAGGLLKMLDVKTAKKKTVYRDPKSGKVYTDKELKHRGIDNRSSSEINDEYLTRELSELDEEERRLREAWRQKGGKEGDLADRLKNTPLGPLAYMLPGAVNRNLTSAADWMSKTYTKASGKVKDLAHTFDDTWVGQTASKAKDTFERRQKLKYNVISVTKVSDDEYLITARDSMYNRQTATLRTKHFYANGVMPTQEITDLCRQKGWVFNIDDPNLSYTEETIEAPADTQASQPKQEQASPYTYTGGKNASYTVSGTKPTGRARTAADVAEEAIPSQDGMSLAVQRTIPDKLDRIIELLGGGKVTKPEGHVDGYDPTVEDPTKWNTKGTFTQEGVPDLILPNEPTEGPDLTQRNRSVEPAPTERKRKPREQDATALLSDTLQTKSDVTQWVPEALQEQVGAIYDNSVKSKHSLGKFLNKLSRDLKLTNSQKKILDDLKRASTVIQDVSTRKEYVGKTLSAVLAYNSSELDAKQRKKALQGIRKDMVDGLEGIQNEISAKQEAAAKKREEKGKGLKGFMRNLKLRWLKFRRSPIGRWIMAHIPDDVKKEVKEAFEKAKGDVKKATDDVKKILTNHNKKAKPGQAQIDPKVLEATQLSGSGDEGEYTPQDILQSAVPDATLQQEDQEGSDDTTKHPIVSKVSSLFHRDRSEDAVANHNRVGFFGKMKNLFHKDRAQAVRDEVPALTTVPTTQEVKATKQEGDTGKPPEGDLKFEGEAESLFHSDFRLFAQRQVADNQALLSAIAGITPGGKRKGILGSIISAGGNIGKGALGAYGRVMAAMAKMYGNLGKGLLIGGGKALGGALKAAPAVGKAVLTPAKLLAKAYWWTTKKTAKGAWAGAKGIGRGAKWLGKKTGQGLSGIGGFLKKDWEQTKEDMSSLWDRIRGKKKGDQDPSASKIKDRVKGGFSKPSDPNAKKKDDDDNVWNRKGWSGLFKSAWEGTKKLGSGIAGLFSKDKEEGSEIPKAGKKLGLDLIFNKLNDIYTLLKEDRDRKVEQQKKDEEAKKDAEQNEANMSAEEQKAAIEAKQKRLEEEAAADAALKKDVGGGPAASVQQVVQEGGGGEGGEGDEEGGLLDMAKDTIKSKALKFARNKLAAGGLKLLRKTKFGRKFLHSGAGKLLRKGIGTFLQKGAAGGLSGRVGAVAGKASGFLGKAMGGIAGKAGGVLSKVGGGALGKLGGAAAGLAGKIGLGGLGSLAGGLAKFAGPVGLAVTAGKALYDGWKGWGSAGESLGVDQSKLNFAEKASGALGGIASGLTFGLLDKGKATRGINWLSRKAGFSTDLDPEERADLEYRAANGDEEAKKKLEEAKGGFWKGAKNLFKYSPVGLAATGISKLFGGGKKKNEKKEEKKGESGGSISIPDNVAKDLAASCETGAECKQEFTEYVNDFYPDASQEDKDKAVAAAMDAHWNSNITGVETKKASGTEEFDEGLKAFEGRGSKKADKTETAADKTDQEVAEDGEKPSIKKKGGFLKSLIRKGIKMTPGASTVLSLAKKTGITGALSKLRGSIKEKGLFGFGKSVLKKGMGFLKGKAKDVASSIKEKGLVGFGKDVLKGGVNYLKEKGTALAGKAADYLENVAANAGGEGFITDLKDIAATGSRALADKLKGGQKERAAYVESIMSMPVEEAVKKVGPEEYEKLRQEYAQTRLKGRLGFWDRITGKKVDTSGMLLGAKDASVMNADGSSSFSSESSAALNATIVNRRNKTTGTVKGLHGALERKVVQKEVVGPDGKVQIVEDFVDNDKDNVVEAMNDLTNIGRYKSGPGEYSDLAQSKRSAKDVYDALDRNTSQQSATGRLWNNLGFKGTKPTGAISTAANVQDKQINLKSDGVTEYIQGKQPDKSSDAALQQASSGNEALLKLTSSGNQDIVGKLAEMVGLMKQQIVVTADSKVAQEKASANGAANALQAAMKYAKETAQNAVADAKPKPQRSPAISVTKPVPA